MWAFPLLFPYSNTNFRKNCGPRITNMDGSVGHVSASLTSFSVQSSTLMAAFLPFQEILAQGWLGYQLYHMFLINTNKSPIAKGERRDTPKTINKQKN